MKENDDPFAGMFGSPQGVPLTADDVADIESEAEAEAEAAEQPRGGSWFVYDLETVPDESRFPKPEPPPKIERITADVDLVHLQGSTVAAITKELPRLSEDQLRHLLQMEQDADKTRAGVVTAIERELLVFDTGAEHAAMIAEWRKLAFQPWGLRIVALGIETCKGEHVTLLAKTPDEERELLRVLWEHVQLFAVRIGYNIHGFDDSVLVARSVMLGVESSLAIDRRRYGSSQSVDLMQMLFPDGRPMKLKELCKWIGIEPEAGYEMSGDQVMDLVEAGDWDGIAKYVHSDAKIEAELYRRIRDYIKH